MYILCSFSQLLDLFHKGTLLVEKPFMIADTFQYWQVDYLEFNNIDNVHIKLAFLNSFTASTDSLIDIFLLFA